MNHTTMAIAVSRCGIVLLFGGLAAACIDQGTPLEESTRGSKSSIESLSSSVIRTPLPGETHFANLKQLTFEGENAEAYFSSDGKQLIFQRRHQGEYDCDQIFTISVAGGQPTLVSTGLGRTTCAYFFPNTERVLYSSTHLSGEECPPPPDFRRGYVWALYDFDIFTAAPDGSDIQILFQTSGYDAEATIAPDGSQIVFTSTIGGDLDIYSMDPDGQNVRQLTDEIGYDGGAFYSPDASKIVYRAQYPEDEAELTDYRRLLADNLVRPGVLDIYVMDADGSNKRRLTDNGAANFAPFFHPSGEKVIFASNVHDPDSRNFDLFLINIDGTGLEQITLVRSLKASRCLLLMVGTLYSRRIVTGHMMGTPVCSLPSGLRIPNK